MTARCRRYEISCDQYGIRSLLSVEGQPIKFEIVREARITLSGEFDHQLGCPLLNLDDQFAETLLANADRCHDPSVRYRDAFDLGMLVIGNGGQLPQAAFDKSVAAYGSDIRSKLRWVVSHLLGKPDTLIQASAILQMDSDIAKNAVLALRDAACRCDPDLSCRCDNEDGTVS